MIKEESLDKLMPSRWKVTAYLNEGSQKALEKWAAEENRSVSNLAATILMNAVKEHQQQDETSSSIKEVKRHDQD